MQIQTNYGSNPYLSSTDSASSGQDQAAEIGKTESPEYKAIRNRALQLLSNPNLSAAEKARILNLLAIGEAAAANGDTGALSNVVSQMARLDPGSAVKGGSFTPGASKPQGMPNQQDEGSATYQDGSGDASVSFKYPVAVNQYEAPLAVSAHEGGHVVAAQARATLNNESVTTYISIHNGYDSRGRLRTTGGTTIAIYHPKPKMAPTETRSRVDTYA